MKNTCSDLVITPINQVKYSNNLVPFVVVIGGFIVHISLGGIFTYGSMFPYILQYMKNCTSKENNQFDTAWVLGMATFGRGASMTLGGFVENKLGSTLTILLGGGIMSIGYILTYLTIKAHIVLVALTYGLIVGLGTGMAYGVAMTVPSEWFPKHRGFLSGFVLSGFGIGSLGFDLVQAYYINSDISNKVLVNPSKVPISFIVMGCIYFVIQIFGAPMIRKPVQQTEENVSEKEFTIFSHSKDINLKPHHLIFVSKFWIIWIVYALNSVTFILFLFLQRMWGKALNLSEEKLVISTSIGGIFSILGRILWGFLVDKYGYNITIRSLSLSVTAMMGTFYLCSKVGNLEIENETNRYIMYSFWVYALYFLFSGNFSLFPAICVEAFGPKNFTGNFGVLFTGYSFSGIVTSIVVLKYYNSQSEVSEYLSPFLTGASFSLLSCFVSLFYRKSSNRMLMGLFT